MTIYEAEEDRNVNIPTMTPTRRGKVMKDLKTLYTTELIPLADRYMPRNSSEEERDKLDGMVMRITGLMRDHCKRKLGMRETDTRRSGRSANRRAEDASEAEKQLETIAKLNDTRNVISALVEIRTIKTRREEGQPEQIEINRIQKLKNKIDSIMRNRSTPIFGEEFGDGGLEEVIRTCDLDQDQFERRIGWLASQIDNEEPTAKKYKEAIQEQFRDNPRKCINRYILKETTPECQITAEQFKDHYGVGWAGTMENYTGILNEDEWNIDRSVGEDFDERFGRDWTDEKMIEKVIRSRNYISAHGRDGISNALFRLALKESTILFKKIFEAIKITRHIPKSWKTSKTVMLYKKGDPNMPKNWRPVGMTSTMYRIMTAHLAGVIQKENKRRPVFHIAQRGFISGGGGPSDHINTLNEMLYKATIVTRTYTCKRIRHCPTRTD